MKKWLVGPLVGAIIVFVWQALSWMMLGIHDESAKYHPQQDQIMEMLSSSNTEEGMYMLPNVAPGADDKAREDLMESMKGKPFASITYISSYSGDMTRAMIRGFLIDFSLVFLLIYILTRAGTPPLANVIGGSVALGLFTWLWGPYTGHNWYQLPWGAITGYLIDGLVAWGLCGVWVGWWLNRIK